MCRRRPVVGIAGIDAHQIGIRVGKRVPLRLMSYSRSFRHLHTHVLCAEPPSGELERDRESVYAALRSGRCYMSVDSVAPPRGFSFAADGVLMGEEVPFDGQTLAVSTPRPATLRLIRDGQVIGQHEGSTLEQRAEQPGVYRIEAQLEKNGKNRTWILSNPIYLRA